MTDVSVFNTTPVAIVLWTWLEIFFTVVNIIPEKPVQIVPSYLYSHKRHSYRPNKQKYSQIKMDFMALFTENRLYYFCLTICLYYDLFSCFVAAFTQWLSIERRSSNRRTLEWKVQYIYERVNVIAFMQFCGWLFLFKSYVLSGKWFWRFIFFSSYKLYKRISTAWNKTLPSVSLMFLTNLLFIVMTAIITNVTWISNWSIVIVITLCQFDWI